VPIYKADKGTRTKEYAAYSPIIFDIISFTFAPNKPKYEPEKGKNTGDDAKLY
jgi:hypothetical protein